MRSAGRTKPQKSGYAVQKVTTMMETENHFESASSFQMLHAVFIAWLAV